MFKNLKDTISDLAYGAVSYAEEALKTSSGQTKKRTAIDFVVNRIPVPYPFKPIVAMLLATFIDEAIEKAVKYMNQVKYED